MTWPRRLALCLLVRATGAAVVDTAAPEQPADPHVAPLLEWLGSSGSALRFGVVAGKAYRGAIATRDVQPGGERGRRPRATSPQPHGADDRQPLALRRCLRGGGGGGGDVR